jgi:hypothetical protein
MSEREEVKLDDLRLVHIAGTRWELRQGDTVVVARLSLDIHPPLHSRN